MLFELSHVGHASAIVHVTDLPLFVFVINTWRPHNGERWFVGPYRRASIAQIGALSGLN
jgi:hypothetical protein